MADTSNIVGAFGYKFGETLSDDVMADCLEAEHCSVTPKAPYYAFSSYLVYLTDTKRRIYEITGLGKPESFFECNAQAENVTRILTKKYGIKFETTEHEAPNGMLLNYWNATIGNPPTGLYAMNKEVTDTTKSVTVLCHDYSGIDGWTGGGTLNLSPVTITIRYKNNAVITLENLELRMDERGL